MLTTRLAAAGFAAALLIAPLTATAADAATACPTGFHAASDSLTTTGAQNGQTVRMHWTGRWCANAARKAVTRVHTHFDGSFTAPDGKGGTVSGVLVRTKSTNSRPKGLHVVLNTSRIALVVPAGTASTTAPGTRVDILTTRFALSPAGWFVAQDGTTRLPDTVSTS